MGKVSTETLSIDGSEKNELKFKYDINVDKEGLFSTTLPQDIVQLFKEANIDLQQNRLRNLGYICDVTLDGLRNKVRAIGLEYMSRELILEKIVLHYVIQTQCSYAKTKSGEICPNPSHKWTGMGYGNYDKDYDPDNKWFSGNVDISATRNSPFGYQIYINPSVKRVYQYKSGKTKTEYSNLNQGGKIAQEAMEKGYYLKWLEAVPCISSPNGASVKEMDYSEDVAEFFVNMIKSICQLNEKIKDFLEPDMILKIAQSKVKLLG